MPAKKRPKPLYQRGKFRLDRRADRDQLVITWYNSVKRRERGVSAGTGDVGQARKVLDRLYLESQGESICPTCCQPTTGGESPLIITAIADYLTLKEEVPGIKGIRARLDHVYSYLEESDLLALRCQQVDEAWVERFRKWMQARPIVSPKGLVRERALSTTENSVLQLAAVINAMDQRGARFKPAQPKDVNNTPTYRADTAMLGAMFAYALEPRKKRDSLLSFLRLSVLTLGRPDAVLEASLDPKLGQWDARNRVFNLNPKGRRQTRKFRASVPVGAAGTAWLNSLPPGPIIKANTIKTAWNRMAEAVGLPGEGEAGSKLIRRSMAELMRAKLLVEHWGEIEVFMGHDKFDATTGLYAPLRPDYLVHAKEAIEAVIADLEALAPGAFYRTVTADEVPEGTAKVA